ncbi:MAG: glutamate-5-semialdehyde dehydrogenase, partial [Methyloceanibacter sp.]
MSAIAGRPEASIEPMMLYMGRLAREAAGELARASTGAKNATLEAMAVKLKENTGKILEANRQDLDAAKKKGRDAAFLDRLALNEARIAAMAKG